MRERQYAGGQHHQRRDAFHGVPHSIRQSKPRAERALAKVGGEGGIRTHVPLTGQDAFEAPPLRPLRYLSGRVRQVRLKPDATYGQVRLKPDTTYGTREACLANVSLYRPLVSRLQIGSTRPPFVAEELLDDRAALVLEHAGGDGEAVIQARRLEGPQRRRQRAALGLGRPVDDLSHAGV